MAHFLWSAQQSEVPWLRCPTESCKYMESHGESVEKGICLLSSLVPKWVRSLSRRPVTAPAGGFASLGPSIQRKLQELDYPAIIVTPWCHSFRKCLLVLGIHCACLPSCHPTTCIAPASGHPTTGCWAWGACRAWKFQSRKPGVSGLKATQLVGQATILQYCMYCKHLCTRQIPGLQGICSKLWCDVPTAEHKAYTPAVATLQIVIFKSSNHLTSYETWWDFMISYGRGSFPWYRWMLQRIEWYMESSLACK